MNQNEREVFDALDTATVTPSPEARMEAALDSLIGAGVLVGTRVSFTEGVRKPRTWKGTVIGHESDGDIISFWPTCRYQGVKGIRLTHSPEFFERYIAREA